MIDVTVTLQESHMPTPKFAMSFDDLNSTFAVDGLSEEDVRAVIGELALQLLEAKKLHVRLQSMIVVSKEQTSQVTHDRRTEVRT